MAFQPQRIKGVLARFKNCRTRYNSLSLHQSFTSFPFSTTDFPVESTNNESSQKDIGNQFSNVDERFVLDELSDLLFNSRRTPNLFTESSSDKNVSTRAVDSFLPPEEKLRGVFLQKLRGKAAVERALTDVGVDLTTDIVAKVVNSGNLGGEAMVIFFNWATKQLLVPKDIYSYNIIIKALGRRKFLKFMVDMLHSMKAEGISPTCETLSIVIDSFVRARRVTRAVQMFGNLEEIGLRPDTESLNVLMQCLCRRSFLGAANSVFDAMKGKVSYNTRTYNLIIRGWSKFGKVSEIVKTVRAMVEDGINPDCFTFSCIIECLGRAGRIDDAASVFDSMVEQGCAPDVVVYNAMISNFISVGDFDECMKYYEQMLNSKCDPNVDTYKKLIAAFIKERRVADALEMFDEMLGQGIVPTTGTITYFIEPLCGYGPPHAALMIYKKAKKVGCRISLSAYKLLLMRLSRFGKCGMLFNIWDDMQESGYSSDTEVYEYVINGLCNIGQLENAALVMEESLHKGFCPSRLICSKLNNKLLASNKVERAYKLFLRIKNARCNENARRYWRAKGWHF
ncbi:putative pentatricopeptide repeat-containing protein At5g43820 [Malania oleifera]|uniref:putative pentatricopeptide repeat-containing protein At5g43820 n=1 Tax=Malania oleifera TaxID=397392 RepID=UPI0025ADE95D|nr:putative pentatricopeptide repeat-containing protein At5g43820 [Malania oleifera]XP_057974458.1 putative pentatricopeptide repeat-containing protein At5g43820 [Malania oleifera]XP_057974459.1 putative pentatricopeptide repeat-containing protein At5g43820 [Malania oleifera]XP_057974460.1 putative pentatricopeptide repeat-containing protein At5g43820 [Malania oleifera]XP_057974461.1 putative pentatricopeptide repeat-containing protein At5g43820 [Malania oleifera]XP_057974462.1 putative pentat